MYVLNTFRSLAVMAKFGKMMSAGDCDHIMRVKSFNLVGDKWYDWFIDRSKVLGKSGDWFFGVVSLNNASHIALDHQNCSKLSKSDLSKDFGFSRYEMRIFTGGCYYFHEKNETWVGDGIEVKIEIGLGSIDTQKICKLFYVDQLQ